MTPSFLCTQHAWCFRLNAPEEISQWTVIRPYWINHPNNPQRDLTDEQIKAELDRAKFGNYVEQVLKTVHDMENMRNGHTNQT